VGGEVAEAAAGKEDIVTLMCQECRGYGRVTEDYILGHALTRPCGYCDGSGEVTPQIRAAWLRDQKYIKRQAKRQAEQANGSD
jgi:DnaJ-class molecular chaperone